MQATYYVTGTLRLIQQLRSWGPVQVGIGIYTRSTIKAYLLGNPVEIQSSTHYNTIGRSMTTPTVCAIAQQYSSASFVSLRFPFPKENIWRFKQVLIFWFSYYCLGLKLPNLKSLELGSICSAFHKLNNTSTDSEAYLIQFENQFFKAIYCTGSIYTVCTRINYKIVPVINLNCGTSGTEEYVCKYRCQ